MGAYQVQCQSATFETHTYEVDVCVVGGGMAGLGAAISAARHGAKVLLMQDRAVLGGNASSEIRMWICGAHGADNKETGILEEIMLENYYRNQNLNFGLWDTVLLDKVKCEEQITLLLNTTCNEVHHEANRITSIKGWQLSSQSWHEVRAKLFVDCSGDSVLRVCGAQYRWGREARREFNESHAPLEADKKTMGNSILIQLREIDPDDHVPFIPPTWANRYTEADLPNRDLKPTGHNFWWLEIGGLDDTIGDSEAIRDELYKISLGIWELIKNHPDGRGHNWELEWIGAVPGKRENVRYVGDHVLTQNEVEAEGKFQDLIAYGGWSMDDHHPEAIRYPGSPTIFHPAPSPYGIPYRVTYSRNIENLMFAGRNISATHMAMSSTRVMATCAIIGQAVGTAAALAIQYQLTPRGVYESKIRELQNTLMDDDCYLPWHTRPMPELTRTATLKASEGDPEPLRSGRDRSTQGEDNGWWGALGASVEYHFPQAVRLKQARLVFDSDLSQAKRMPCSFPRKGNRVRIPEMMTRDFDLEVLNDQGLWVTVEQVCNNYQRLVKRELNVTARAIRFVPRASWGGQKVHLFGFDVS